MVGSSKLQKKRIEIGQLEVERREVRSFENKIVRKVRYWSVHDVYALVPCI